MVNLLKNKVRLLKSSVDEDIPKPELSYISSGNTQGSYIRKLHGCFLES